MVENWTTADYPGATVKIARLIHGQELGSVRIQKYDDNVRVATFLPGRDVFLPGDTPKIEPERDEWFSISGYPLADKLFDQYVKEAKEDGWVDYPDLSNNDLHGGSSAARARA